MATTSVRLPALLRPLRSTLQPTSCLRPWTQTRAFLPNPFASSSSSEPQVLTATRTLPYASGPIYTIISDVSSYSSFLPYCQSSNVTQWSAPDAKYKRQWPSEGELVVGYGNLTESFTSRVYCIPGKAVESVGGDTETSLDRHSIMHHLEGETGRSRRSAGGNGLLTHLRSRWNIEALQKGRDGSEKTGVTLSLEFAFANPMYAALSAGVAPKVAEIMIKAFEERVTRLLENNPELARASLDDMSSTAPSR